MTNISLPSRAAILVALLTYWPIGSASAEIVTFDFEALACGQSVPCGQTSGSVTADFGSTPSAGFSIQDASTTHYTLSQFSNHYLWPNSTNHNFLDIQFSQPLTNITLTFATIDYTIEVPSDLRLIAYLNSTATTVGSATAHGAYSAPDSYPQGTISFDSGGQPFNMVHIGIPVTTQGTEFMVDNITVTTIAPEPSAL